MGLSYLTSLRVIGGSGAILRCARAVGLLSILLLVLTLSRVNREGMSWYVLVVGILFLLLPRTSALNRRLESEGAANPEASKESSKT